MLVIAIIAVTALSYASPKQRGWAKKHAVETSASMATIAAIPNTLSNWPPVLGKSFPDVKLFDHEGKEFSFNSLKGKPVLIEFVAMTCAACQAWSGAHKHGVFDGFAAQEGLEDIERYFKDYTPELDLFDGTVSFVQLINYDTALEAPTPESLARWRKHFQFDGHPNVYIVSGGEPLRNKETFVRTPGFLLLDKNLIIQFDALGHTPHHDLFRELLPGVRRVVGEIHRPS